MRILSFLSGLIALLLVPSLSRAQWNGSTQVSAPHEYSHQRNYYYLPGQGRPGFSMNIAAGIMTMNDGTRYSASAEGYPAGTARPRPATATGGAITSTRLPVTPTAAQSVPLRRLATLSDAHAALESRTIEAFRIHFGQRTASFGGMTFERQRRSANEASTLASAVASEAAQFQVDLRKGDTGYELCAPALGLHAWQRMDLTIAPGSMGIAGIAHGFAFPYPVERQNNWLVVNLGAGTMTLESYAHIRNPQGYIGETVGLEWKADLALSRILGTRGANKVMWSPAPLDSMK